MCGADEGVGLFMAINDILAEIIRISKKHGVKEIWLYGSHANETFRPGSDIDIAIDGCDDINRLKFMLNESIGTLKTINPAFIPNEKDSANNLFRREVLNGRKIHG